MKRVLLLLATVSAFAMVQPAAAQTARTDRTDVSTDQRPAIDLTDLAQRMRDRGVPEADVAGRIARIRELLASGASPERIRAILQGGAGGNAADRPERRDGADRPDRTRQPGDATRPDATRTRDAGTTRVRPTDVQQTGTAVRPTVVAPQPGSLRVTRTPTGG